MDTYSFEYIAILLARQTHKPVKILFDRKEEFQTTSTRQPAVIDIAQGCTKEGRLTFRDITMILDNGAYTSWGATTPSVMMLPISSLYRVPNVRYIAKCVYTNNTYSQAMRGYGNPQATFAIESQIDRLAEQAGLDPLEFQEDQQQSSGGDHSPGFQNHHLRPEGLPGNRGPGTPLDRKTGATEKSRDRHGFPDPCGRRGPGL